MMTTMAAMLGAIPMALGYGAGGEARASAGSDGGRRPVVSQMMTLYLTPVVYTYMAGFLNRWRRTGVGSGRRVELADAECQR